MCYSQRSGPGVLILHEFFGLQDSFKDYAGRLSNEGFTVLAPDLYDGKLAQTVDEATTMSDELDFDYTAGRVQAAADFLVDNWHPRLGVIGFSLGAMFADALARSRPVEATIFYYGGGRVGGEGFNGPLLAHFAENDEWMTEDEVRELLERFEQGSVDVESHVYPGTGHWFANSAVPEAFSPEASELAFDRTVEFLRHHLS